MKAVKVELREVGREDPFKVSTTSHPGHDEFLWMLTNSGSLKLINEDESYSYYSVESRTMEESSPGEFSYVVRVRKYIPAWAPRLT
jgi:hypothetical protein